MSRPHTHVYEDEDEDDTEDNRHEFGVLPHHGMSSGQLAAMFAKVGSAVSGKKLGAPGGQRFTSRANEKKVLGDNAKPVKQQKNILTGKSSNPLAAPKLSDFKAAKTPKMKTAKAPKVPKAGHEKKGHKEHKSGGHEGGHSPLGVLKSIGNQVKEAGHKTVNATIAASGHESTIGAIKGSAKGHKFGDPGDGRHEDH